MPAHNHQHLERLFSPRHVAMIGATEKNIWFGNALDNKARMNAPITFYPVNARTPEVLGQKTYASIADLPEGIIEVAVVMLNAGLVEQTLLELKAKGITDVILLTSGYAETGAEGAGLQKNLKKLCQEHGINLLGPNSLGFIRPPEQLSVFLGGSVIIKPEPGVVGLIGQSGASSELIILKLHKRRLGLSLYISSGNEELITVEDCLEFLVHDSRTRIVTAFIEGFRNIPKLTAVAKDAARLKKPIILVKVGRSAQGVQAASSHTGALAGNTAVQDGFFRQLGIIRVDSIEELVETASMFERCPLPAGDGVAICTLSGGLCGLYADLSTSLGISLPALQPETIARLRSHLPPFAQPANPLDVTGAGFMNGMETVLEMLLADPGIDVVVPFSMPPAQAGDELPDHINGMILPLLRASAKPVMPIIFREMTPYAYDYFADQGVHVIEHPATGFKALKNIIDYAAFLRRCEGQR